MARSRGLPYRPEISRSGTSAVEQIAEGLLVPGVIGYHFDDMTLMVGTERRLQFAMPPARRESWTRDKRLSGPQLAPWSSNLLVRTTGTPSFTLADLTEACDSLLNAANTDTNTMFFATTSGQQAVVAIMGA